MDTLEVLIAKSLVPIPPFTWFGLSISTLDVAGTARLVLIMRQLREMVAASVARDTKSPSAKVRWDEPSPVKDLAATWTVVFGGEWVACSLLGLRPSFLTSPTYLLLYAGIHTLVASMPTVPAMSLQTEIPFSLLDGLTRAYLTCRLLPTGVLNHTDPIVNSSPWSLMIISFLGTNAGFFLVGLFGMLRPEGLRVSTPTELQAYGWTTVDLWSAPLATALYAYWTNAQPWWGELHAKMLGYAHIDESVLRLTAVDPQTALTRCMVVLSVLFAGRAYKNFRPASLKEKTPTAVPAEKKQQ